MKNFYSLVLSSVLLLLTQSVFAQVPTLSSYPAASAVIYLDFDGQMVNGTSWNSSGPLNLSSANMSNERISEVYNRMAEDYRPFNINITTDSTKYWAAPATRRIRVILTTSYEWYGQAGGVAFLNSFTWGDNTPAFVFTSLLGYNAKNVAEAASHEAGHALGLRHQASYDNCVKISEYNSGMGTGEIGWAPIMGVGYSRNLTQWNNGANPLGCDNIQDDLGIITGMNNGFGYRTDDHANTFINAAPVNFNGSSFVVPGVIERTTDVDVVSVKIPVRGKLKVDAVPFAVGNGNNGSNLDLQIELLDRLGQLIGVYNPANSLSATADTTLNAGDYFIRIKGSGNINAPEYASLGSYTMNGAYTVMSTLPLYKLELAGIVEKGMHIFNWEVIADEAIVAQVIEVSTDGVNYKKLQNSTVAARSFAYAPTEKGMYYYRLHMKFDDGKQYYSNTVKLKSDGATVRSNILGNIVTSELKVNSAVAQAYAVFDMKGRIIQKGNLQAGLNHISLNYVSSGMYLFQFADMSGIIQTEKFVKR